MRLIVHVSHQKYLNNPTIENNLAYIILANRQHQDLFPEIQYILLDKIPFIAENIDHAKGYYNGNYTTLKVPKNIPNWIERQNTHYQMVKVNRALGIYN